MLERNIRNYRSSRTLPPLFCKVKIENGKATLIRKDEKNKFIEIRWDDIRNQVESAIEDSKTNK